VTEEIVLRDFAGYVAQNRYGPWRGYWSSFWRSRDGHGGCNSHPTREDAMAALRQRALDYVVLVNNDRHRTSLSSGVP
jgi:hypothetical protein